MTKKSKWEKELKENKSIDGYCEDVINKINISKKNKPIITDFCKKYLKTLRRFPTKDELIKMDKMEEEPEFEIYVPPIFPE
ncbi:MAG: hypothetical protein ACTSO9_06865, partial [Candidatus Helarchaeota archaeon]